MLLRPGRAWQGANLVMELSRRGGLRESAHQLRDPAIFIEGDSTFLLCAVAGESGIAIAEICSG